MLLKQSRGRGRDQDRGFISCGEMHSNILYPFHVLTILVTFPFLSCVSGNEAHGPTHATAPYP